MTLHHGDCREVMADMESNSIDAIVTDPPYELGFMGKKWDSSGVAYDPLLWAEALRVLKPGGHLLAFGGTRTYHRMACAIEDAGFEIRDSIHWIYGSGFPKSLDVSKAIDKAAGAERERKPVQLQVNPSPSIVQSGFGAPEWSPQVDEPATPEAARWQGWGTALKPAHEPVVVARKPLVGTVAANVLEYGTGALNIDECRIEGDVPSVPQPKFGVSDGVYEFGAGEGRNGEMSQASGRWPANIVLDEDAAAELDAQSGVGVSGTAVKRNGVTGWGTAPVGTPDVGYGDTGGASRFFYCAKASSSERNAGMDELPESVVSVWGGDDDDLSEGKKSTVPRRNIHPTVKPLDLMRWLVRLVTPPGGTVLDPFMGSGTTAEACVIEGFEWVGIEQNADYIPLIEARLSKPIQPVMFG